MARPRARHIVVCIDNDGYEASLESRKIYIALPDIDAGKDGLVRIIDESGEDYLYPRTLFRSVELPQAIRRAILTAA